MKKIKLAAAVALSLVACASQAQQSNDSGYYGIAQFGITTGKSDINSVGHYTGSGTSQSNNWGLGLGYDLNKTFAVEGYYGDFYRKKNESSISYTGGTSSEGSTSTGSGFMFNGLAKNKVSDNTTLFAGPSAILMKLKSDAASSYSASGGYGSTVTNSESKNVSMYGLVVGASFDLDKRTALRVSYAQYNGFTWDHPKNAYNYYAYSEKTKVSNMGLGLVMKF